MIRTFKELKRAAKGANSGGSGALRIAVGGDVATQLFTVAIRGALQLRGFAVELFEMEYNQVARQVLAADSELHYFNPDITILWEAVERWWVTNEPVEARLARVRAYAEAMPGQVVYANAASYNDGTFGNLAMEMSFAVRVRQFNAGLDALVAELPNLSLVDLNSLVATLGRQQAYDPLLEATSDMPLSLEAQARFAELVADVIAAQRGYVRKCVVVDLDNTLWAGILGEDGVEGVEIGGHGLGWAHLELQRWLFRLRQRGILLAVCSKNDDALAREAFEVRKSEMALHLEDVACFVANWETKADNIAHIQRVLNIGMDSFVFLDDNPAEREMVRQAHPEVCVPELPQDPALWVAMLSEMNLFETASYSEADVARTEQYRIEAERVAFQASFKDEAGFLRSLEMVATAKPLTALNLLRATQLTQRSNQFNLRTVRYTEAELEHIAEDPAWVTVAVTLADRFGEHGLVNVLLVKKEGTAAFIDTWVMSCRVLKRGLEVWALNRLVQRLREEGITRLEGEYRPTKKNGMVAHLYDELGFTSLGEGRFELDLTAYVPKETYIHEEDN